MEMAVRISIIETTTYTSIVENFVEFPMSLITLCQKYKLFNTKNFVFVSATADLDFFITHNKEFG